MLHLHAGELKANIVATTFVSHLVLGQLAICQHDIAEVESTCAQCKPLRLAVHRTAEL